MDLIVVAFVAGFALASLIFWPLLHRTHRRLSAHASQGKHALRTVSKEPATPAESASRPVSRASSSAAATSHRSAAPADDSQTTGSNQSAGAHRIKVELSPMPELPSDLYESRFEAKFNRTRQRLARLRAQLHEMADENHRK